MNGGNVVAWSFSLSGRNSASSVARERWRRRRVVGLRRPWPGREAEQQPQPNDQSHRAHHCRPPSTSDVDLIALLLGQSRRIARPLVGMAARRAQSKRPHRLVVAGMIIEGAFEGQAETGISPKASPLEGVVVKSLRRLTAYALGRIGAVSARVVPRLHGRRHGRSPPSRSAAPPTGWGAGATLWGDRIPSWGSRAARVPRYLRMNMWFLCPVWGSRRPETECLTPSNFRPTGSNRAPVVCGGAHTRWRFARRPGRSCAIWSRVLARWSRRGSCTRRCGPMPSCPTTR